MDQYNKIFSNKKRVLVVTAHPDDAEVNSGGLIARLIADNKEVRLIVMTNGINGSRDKKIPDRKSFAATRLRSQYRSSRILGLKKKNVINLGITDGKVENNLETIEKLVFNVRQFKPDIVITHNPDFGIIHYNDSTYWVNHRDHRNTAMNLIDAIYPYARDTGFFETHLALGLEVHSVEEILFFEKYNSKSEVFIDISEFIKTKKNALLKHKSANVLTDEDINVFINENSQGHVHYERFGYVRVNRLNSINQIG